MRISKQVIGDFKQHIFINNNINNDPSSAERHIYQSVNIKLVPVRVVVVMQGFPEIDEVTKASVKLCRRDAREEEERYGRMPPCRKMAPLSPPLRLDEYFMMERDEGKCE